MLEVAISLHLHLKSAVTADWGNLMIGLLLHNDLITASLRAALDDAASQVSRFQESIAYTLMSLELYDNVNYWA